MYSIYRYFMNGDIDPIASGLTLEEAKEHCKDPNTSSKTCSEEVDAQNYGRGPWFDGFEEE